MRAVLVVLIAVAGNAADVCPHPPGDGSFTTKIGRRHCLANAVSASGTVEWPAAGIERASVAGRLEFAVCCFSKEAARPAPLRIDGTEKTVETHVEVTHHEEDDEADFPDLIEDDAHVRSASIRGTLGNAAHPVRVDIELRCSASKFADQFAMQFTVINRSPDKVLVEWDHLRELEARVRPSAQGNTKVFLVKTRPTEAAAGIELKSPGGEVLGRFHFDGWK